MAVIEGKHYWDNKEIEFVKECREKGMTFSLISKIMSKEFGREYTRAEISSANRRYVKTGLTPNTHSAKLVAVKDLACLGGAFIIINSSSL